MNEAGHDIVAPSGHGSGLARRRPRARVHVVGPADGMRRISMSACFRAIEGIRGSFSGSSPRGLVASGDRDLPEATPRGSGYWPQRPTRLHMNGRPIRSSSPAAFDPPGRRARDHLPKPFAARVRDC